MKRKSTVILLIVSFAFLTSMIIFYSTANMQIPGGKEKKHVGVKGIEIFKSYYQGEEILYFLDLAAKYSYNKAKKSENIEEIFENELSKYLKKMNEIYGTDLKIDDFDIEFKKNETIGICLKKITIYTQNSEYSFVPNFKVVG